MTQWQPTHRYLEIRSAEWIDVRLVPVAERLQAFRWIDAICDTVVETEDGRQWLVGRVFLEAIAAG